MEIRKARESDIPTILSIYSKAKDFMRRTGNMHQWNDGYPSEENIKCDLSEGCCYVCCINDRLVGTFFFKIGTEPTYHIISEGKWLNDLPYGVIHRVASDGTTKRLMDNIVDYCLTKVDNIRIDTHHDNLVMQNCLKRYGFTYCGIIYLNNGDERLAYHYTK